MAGFSKVIQAVCCNLKGIGANKSSSLQKSEFLKLIILIFHVKLNN
jgi:hypothetical protein